jgi:flagellar basal body-associated protein FliL
MYELVMIVVVILFAIIGMVATVLFFIAKLAASDATRVATRGNKDGEDRR